MSARALEFVETWVSEKIEAMNELPTEGAALAAQKLASECIAAAQGDGIPEAEIKEAFDDLAAFIGGEIQEAKEREAPRSDDDASKDDDA